MRSTVLVSLAQPRTKGPEVELTAETVRSGPDQPDGHDGGPREAFIRRLDRNGDGKVSRSEFDGPTRHFRQFDKDGDGFISRDEAPSSPPPRPGPRR